MKAAKLLVLSISLVIVACGQATSNSSLKDDGDEVQSDEAFVAAAAAESLPGKPQAVGFRVVTTSTLNYLVRISPGAPVLAGSVWSVNGTPSLITLHRQDPCTSSSTGWTCRYLSADGMTGFTVRYRAAAPDTFTVKAIIQDGERLSDDDIMPPPNPTSNAATGCDPTDPLSCPWFQ